MKNPTLNFISIMGFLCIYNSSSGQVKPGNCDFRQYAHYVNLAELSITDSAYQKAIASYDSAGLFIDSPFAKDRYNKTVCYALTSEYDHCRSGLIYLFGKGLDRQKIRDNPAFTEFLLSETGKDLPDLEVELTYNTRLRLVYDSLHAADQYFRIKHLKDYHDYDHDTITKIDASNVKTMNRLIVEYGWPTEDLIGIEDLGFQQYEIIIIHQHNYKYQIYNYAEDVKEAYENCRIDVSKAAYLIMESTGRDDMMAMDAGLVTYIFDPEGYYKHEDLMLYRHKTGFFRLKEDKKEVINQKRRTFGLEPIDDLRRKVMFSERDKRFCFHFNGGKTGFTTANIEDYEYAAKNIVEF